jgi:hypothetical protein
LQIQQNPQKRKAKLIKWNPVSSKQKPSNRLKYLPIRVSQEDLAETCLKYFNPDN